MIKNINDYQLTRKVKVGQLRKWMTAKDAEAKKQIIDLVYHRFDERYIKHILNARAGF